MTLDDLKKRYSRMAVWIGQVFLWGGLMLSVGSAVYGAELVDRIVAIVNDDIIALSELNRQFAPYAEKIRSMGYPSEKEREMIFRVREDILNRIVDQTLTNQEIKRAKISASEKEIDQAIERIKQTGYLTDEDMRKVLSEQGMTMETYRNNIREQILRTRLVVREVRSKIVITDEDIKAYYDAHQDVYGGEKKYHLKNIMMKIPSYAGQSDREGTRKRMAAIARKLDAGEPFERLARKYSEGAQAADGGDLGTFKLDSLSPQLRRAIEEIGTGNHTPVLETDQGYQIFYIQNIIQSAGKPLAEVSPEIHEKLYNQVVEEKYSSWIKDLRERSHVRIIQ